VTRGDQARQFFSINRAALTDAFKTEAFRIRRFDRFLVTRSFYLLAEKMDGF